MNSILFYKNAIEKRMQELLEIDFGIFDNHIKAMKYSVFTGGKRIRPCLLMEFARICDGDTDYALDLAASVEFIQTYSLIHDDLPCMDNDDLRRGKPACHIAFGENTALLAGDALLTLAFNVATRSENANSAKCVNVLSEYAGVCGMIGGQVIDLATENTQADKETVLKMYTLKTSRLLQAACVLGATLSNAADVYVNAAREFAENLGIAFQITDDILDVTSTTEKLGKPVGSDEDNNKNNFVSLLGLDAARKEARLYTDRALQSLVVFGDKAENLLKFTEDLLIRET